MAYKFNLADTDEFFYSQDNKESSILLPNNFGSINTHREIIHNDISLIKSDLYSSCDISISTEFLTKSLSIGITLQGQTTLDNVLSKTDTKYTENNTLIEYTNGTNGIWNIQKDTPTKGLTILIKDDFLQKHFFANLKDKDRMTIEKNYHENITTNLKSALSNARTLFLANEIYNSPFSGSLNSIYLQSKVYEIIHNEFSSLLIEQKYIPSDKMKLSQEDISALHKAKEIMMTAKQIVSIPQLARAVALNENKLKHGFKHLFNTSPGAVMFEQRMYKAKELLQDSELNVTEISNIVGYKYVQSFTIAFKKYFGESPSALMKDRKYYF